MDGMTDTQYKGVLLDAKQDWEELLKFLEEPETPDVEKAKAWARQQAAKIDEKLKM